MRAKDFYKNVLSLKVLFFMLAFGVWFYVYAVFLEQVDALFLLYFSYVYLSLIIVAELSIAFLRTWRLLSHCKYEYPKKVRFNLLFLTYMPVLMCVILYGAIRIKEYGVLYKREFIIALGIALITNFLFSIIYNVKIKIFNLLEYPHI